MGETVLAAIDSRLAEAEFLANEYIAAVANGQNPLPRINIDANEINLSLISNNYLLAFSNLYCYYVNDLIGEWAEAHPEYYVGVGEDLVWLSIDITSEDENIRGGIQIFLWIDASMFTTADDNRTIIRKDNVPRYIVEDWYQYQPPVDIEPPVHSFWDGTF
jgi:hypothetical protein